MRVPRRPLFVPALLAAACLSPRPDASRYYTLSPEAGPSAGRAPVAALGVGPVVLPPYLERNEFAFRVGPEQIAYASEERWAAPLSDLFVRALGEDLRALVPATQVVPWPFPRISPPDLSVAVEVLRFETDPAGVVVLQARFSLQAGAGGRVLARGETRFREEVTPRHVGEAAAAMSRGIGALARDVAGAAAGIPGR